MIKNEKQYKISNKRLAEVTAKIDKITSATEVNDLKKEMLLASLENIKEEVQKEVNDYSSLKSGKSTKLKERNISELPNLIIEYKIANNLTHKEFSQRLGLKEQQLQRYESEGFKSVSFQNLVKFINIMNLNLKIKETSIKRRKAKKSTLQP